MIASIAAEGQRTRPAPFGHALIGEALYAGLDATVRAYRRIVDAATAACSADPGCAGSSRG